MNDEATVIFIDEYNFIKGLKRVLAATQATASHVIGPSSESENGPMIPLGFYAEIITLRDPATNEENHFSADWSSEELQAFIRERPDWKIRIQEVLTPFHDQEGDEGEEVLPFDTRLTPYPETVTIGDYVFPIDSAQAMRNDIGRDDYRDWRGAAQLSTAQADFEDVNASRVKVDGRTLMTTAGIKVCVSNEVPAGEIWFGPDPNGEYAKIKNVKMPE